MRGQEVIVSLRVHVRGQINLPHEGSGVHRYPAPLSD